jgi:hypothetical protein
MMLKEIGILNTLFGSTSSLPLGDKRLTPLTRRRKRSKTKKKLSINKEITEGA